MKPNARIIDDRRAHDRYPLRTEVLVGAPDGSRHVSRMLDIGKGGMALVVPFNAAVGTTLHVQARLPTRPKGNAVFEARAVVVNCVLSNADGGFRIGIQFHPLGARAQEVLTSCLP